MNPGTSPSGDAIFLVKCADDMRLAVRSANGTWKNFHDDTPLPGAAEAILPIPFELVLPFLPDATYGRLSPIPLRVP